MCIIFDIENYLSDTEECLRETDIIVNLLLENAWDVFTKENNIAAQNVYSLISIINLINKEHIKYLETFSEKFNCEYKKALNQY